MVSDEKLIEAWEPAVEALASLFGPGCEVVLHSFDSLQSSVKKISNGHVTGRQTGAPVTDFALQKLMASSGQKWSTYFSRTKDGQMMKSTSITIDNQDSKPIGMLCVNFSLNTPLTSLIEAFSLQSGLEPNSTEIEKETFANSVEDLIDQIIQQVKSDTSLASNTRNKEIVTKLFERGVFELKDSTALVAQKLGVSKHTVYLHIRNHKKL